MRRSPALAVVVADDQPLFRAGLAGAIEHHPTLELVAEAADGRRALEEIRQRRPGLAVCDLGLPGIDGLGVLGAVRRERLPTRVVLLAAEFSEQDVRRALSLCAGGLVCKQTGASELRDALLAVGRGEQVLDPRLQHRSGGDDGRFERDDGTRPLTPREREVLQLMAEGLSGPQIARELIVSPSTIKSHVENLYSKLGVSHRGAAVAEGMRRGLLE